MAKSVCVRSVGGPLTGVERIKCSVAGAKMNWSAKSARDDDCATTGVIRAEKKTGKKIPPTERGNSPGKRSVFDQLKDLSVEAMASAMRSSESTISSQRLPRE
jgi:hypothetical protein